MDHHDLLAPEDFDFLRCDTVLRMEMLFPDVVLTYREHTELTLWVSYDQRVLKICFVGVRDLKMPRIKGVFQMGELSVHSIECDGLEGIRYQATDELTGFYVLAWNIQLSWLDPFAQEIE